MSMPEILNWDQIAWEITDKFPEFFDAEGQSYGPLHKLEEVSKSIATKHKADIAQAVKEAEENQRKQCFEVYVSEYLKIFDTCNPDYIAESYIAQAILNAGK